jgi:DNA-directed RNA polymerase specialized sigma24 family protein
MRPRIATLVRAKLRFEDSIAGEDVVAGIALELAERFASDSNFPRSWFDSERPPNSEVNAFHALVQRVAERRILDRIRHHYVETRLRSELDAAPHVPPGDAVVEARRILRVLADALEELTTTQREALSSFVGGHGKALSNRDRQRIHRLRMQLAEVVAQRLTKQRK